MPDIGVESRPNTIPETSQMSFPVNINTGIFSHKTKPNMWLQDKSLHYDRSQETVAFNHGTAEKRLNGAR